MNVSFRKVFPVILGMALAAPASLDAQSTADGTANLRITGFGSAVAVFGDEVFVGRPGVVSFFPSPASQLGTVHVFRRGAAHGWTESDVIVTDEPSVGEGFGSALAVEGDVLAVAAPSTDGGKGAVLVFHRGSDLQWAQVARLQPDDLTQGDSFGTSVTVGGGTLMVGAPDQGEAGSVYVFRRDMSGNAWRVAAKLEGGEAGERFGASLSINDDGVLIGAPGTAIGFAGGPPVDVPGAAYVYRNNDGSWDQEARMVSGDARVRSMGTSVNLGENDALLGAPISSGFVGGAVAFSRDDAGNWTETDFLSPAGVAPPAGLGFGLARAGSDLFLGAPLINGLSGGFYIFRMDDSGQWSELQAVQTPQSVGFIGGAGIAMAAGGTVAVAGSPGDKFFEGLAHVYERGAGGEWTRTSSVFDIDESLVAVNGEQIDCAEDGTAGAFNCSDVELVSFMPVDDIGGERGIMMNDVWGWTDSQTGKEWVIAGRFDGTSFVDISDPANPVYVGDLPLTEGANANLWRDMKVYANHAYIVADNAGAHGIQIFDLTQLRGLDGSNPVTFEETAHYSEINSAHNIVINEETGFAYVVGASGGGTTCGGGLHMVDIREPTNPTFAGCFQDMATGRQNTGYSHDAQCLLYAGPDEEYQGREICFGANETALSIADVTNKDSTVAVSNATYPSVAYSHQGWISDDHRFFFLNDELDELSGVEKTRTLVWDIEDLDDPILLKEYMGETGATDHNLYVKGNYMYQANYVSGLRIIDVRDPENPREVGHFDTVPLGLDAPGFAGAFSNYPYFESGTIVVTSMREGLFMLKQREEQLVP